MRGVTGRIAALRRTAPAPRPRRPPGPGPVPECPPGWRTGPPDFVGVGAKKAGTSWWHRLVTRHPEVHERAPAVPGLDPPGVKEVHFFQERWASSLDAHGAAEYHRYFPRPPGLLVGEWTPRYMADFWTPAQLRVAAPDARLLVMLRDPVARYASGVSHYRARHAGVEHPRVLVDEVEHGRYGAALARLTRHFPPERVLVLQFERCVAEPAAELERTFRFLGVGDPGFLPPDLSKPVNAARGERWRMDGGLRAELVAEYEPDVLRLFEQWPAVDPALWPNFAHLAR